MDDRKIVVLTDAFNQDKFHVVHKEKNDTYLTGGGWNTSERALEEYDFRIKHGFNTWFEIKKDQFKSNYIK